MPSHRSELTCELLAAPPQGQLKTWINPTCWTPLNHTHTHKLFNWLEQKLQWLSKQEENGIQSCLLNVETVYVCITPMCLGVCYACLGGKMGEGEGV